MPLRLVNNARATLAAPLDSYSDMLELEEGALSALVGQDDWMDGDFMYVTLYQADSPHVHEIVKIIGVWSDAPSVERAQEGTQAREWPAGTQVGGFVTAQTLRDVGGLSLFADKQQLKLMHSFQYVNMSEASISMSVASYQPLPGQAVYFYSEDDEAKSSVNPGLFYKDVEYADHVYLSTGHTELSLSDLSALTDWGHIGMHCTGTAIYMGVASPNTPAYNGSVSFGCETIAAGYDTVAIGSKAMAKPRTFNYYGGNPGAVAVGTVALALNDETSALGYHAQAFGPEASAIGTKARAFGRRSTAVGFGAKAQVDKQFAISGIGVLSAPGEPFAHDANDFLRSTTFETVVASQFCDIGTPKAWTANTLLRHGDVVVPTTGGENQYVVNILEFAHWLQDNAYETGDTEPDWGAYGAYEGQALEYSAITNGVGMTHEWEFPAHTLFMVTEVGFIAHQMDAGVTNAGSISLGSMDGTTMLLSDVALPGTPVAGRMHRISIESPIGLADLKLTLAAIASTGSYLGHFYLRGMAVRTQG